MNGVGLQAAFISLALLTVVSAAASVRVRNIVHAGYWLLPCFVGIAGLFALLEAHFFFVVQLLIYVGAILVLILFALMLTRDVMNPAIPQTNRAGFVACVFCALGGLFAAWAVTQQAWPSSSAVPAAPAEQTRALGADLIGLYAVPFEVASLLLLAALIGAIVLAKSERLAGASPAAVPSAEAGEERPAGVEETRPMVGAGR